MTTDTNTVSSVIRQSPRYASGISAKNLAQLPSAIIDGHCFWYLLRIGRRSPASSAVSRFPISIPVTPPRIASLWS
jgi:hypothetical protein